jgi:hypothetical protein
LQDRIFPLSIGLATLLCCAFVLLRMLRAPATDEVFADLERGREGEAPFTIWRTFAWFMGLLGLSLLNGMVIALTLFPLAFLRIRARLPWSKALLHTAGGVGFIVMLAAYLGRDFPPGLLQWLIDLPWPLR